MAGPRTKSGQLDKLKVVKQEHCLAHQHQAELSNALSSAQHIQSLATSAADKKQHKKRGKLMTALRGVSELFGTAASRADGSSKATAGNEMAAVAAKTAQLVKILAVLARVNPMGQLVEILDQWDATVHALRETLQDVETKHQTVQRALQARINELVDQVLSSQKMLLRVQAQQVGDAAAQADLELQLARAAITAEEAATQLQAAQAQQASLAAEVAQLRREHAERGEALEQEQHAHQRTQMHAEGLQRDLCQAEGVKALLQREREQAEALRASLEAGLAAERGRVDGLRVGAECAREEAAALSAELAAGKRETDCAPVEACAAERELWQAAQQVAWLKEQAGTSQKESKQMVYLEHATTSATWSPGELIGAVWPEVSEEAAERQLQSSCTLSQAPRQCYFGRIQGLDDEAHRVLATLLVSAGGVVVEEGTWRVPLVAAWQLVDVLELMQTGLRQVAEANAGQ